MALPELFVLNISQGFSDLNLAGSATAATQDVGGSVLQDTPEQPRKVCHPISSMRQRKRRQGGRASWDHGGARCSSQGRLDKALASFLTWQQSAEERLLSLEEVRLEQELQAEERREQREERRAEQERQHELRLFSMLTGVLTAARQGTPSTETMQTRGSALLTTTASVSPSLSQPLSGSPPVQAISSQETTKSILPTSAKACKMSQNALGMLKVAEPPGHSMYLSNRGNSIRQQRGILQEGFAQYATDRYHDADNPDVSLRRRKHPAVRACNDYLQSSCCFSSLIGCNQHGHQWEQTLLWSASQTGV